MRPIHANTTYQADSNELELQGFTAATVCCLRDDQQFECTDIGVNKRGVGADVAGIEIYPTCGKYNMEKNSIKKNL